MFPYAYSKLNIRQKTLATAQDMCEADASCSAVLDTGCRGTIHGDTTMQGANFKFCLSKNVGSLVGRLFTYSERSRDTRFTYSHSSANPTCLRYMRYGVVTNGH